MGDDRLGAEHVTSVPTKARRDRYPTAEVAAPSPTRDKILEAAVPLFELRGAGGTTIRQIAAAAGVNSQLIYYYFGDKEGLFSAALEQVGGQVSGALDAASGDATTARAQLARFVLDWVMITLAQAPAVRMLHRAMLEGNAALSADIERIAGGHSTKLAELIAKGVAEGAFRADVDPMRAVASLVGMVQYLALAEPFLPPVTRKSANRANAQDVARHTAELFLRGLDSR